MNEIQNVSLKTLIVNKRKKCSNLREELISVVKVKAGAAVNKTMVVMHSIWHTSEIGHAAPMVRKE